MAMTDASTTFSDCLCPLICSFNSPTISILYPSGSPASNLRNAGISGSVASDATCPGLANAETVIARYWLTRWISTGSGVYTSFATWPSMMFCGACPE